MKRFLSSAVLLLLVQGVSQSATQLHSVDVRQTILTNSGQNEVISRQMTGFRMEIIGDSDGLKSERSSRGRPWVSARPGESYTIRLYNPLPVRVAVNLSIDGLNSITGQPSGIKDGSKWLIEPYSFIDLRGWQVNGVESRRFFFTDKPKSYVQWREEQTGKPLAANAGVIGAAYFWSQRDLDGYYAARPIDERTVPQPSDDAFNNGAGAGMVSAARSAPVDMAAKGKLQDLEKKAATGMGDRESHPTTEVSFDYDRGMYHPRETLMVYYGFDPVPTPNPFPDMTYAPEMPR